MSATVPSVRAKKSGLSADVQKKLDAKYDIEQEKQCRAWIEAVVGTPLVNQEVGKNNFAECLHDGQVLCALMNVLVDNIEPQGKKIPKISNLKTAFKQMENIEKFLTKCKDFGLKDGDLFQTADLYEVQNMAQVIANLYAVSTVATSRHHYAGPSIGTRLADPNVREFDQATLDAGKNVLGAQMGWTGGENQSGMSLGKTRKVCD